MSRTVLGSNNARTAFVRHAPSRMQRAQASTANPYFLRLASYCPPHKSSMPCKTTWHETTSRNSTQSLVQYGVLRHGTTWMFLTLGSSYRKGTRAPFQPAIGSCESESLMYR